MQPIFTIDAHHLNQLNFKELWQYKELFWVLAYRDIIVRYKQTILGILWALLQPLTTMVIFSVLFGVFAKIPSGNLPYPIFVFSGMLPWILFSSLLGQSSSAMLSSSHLIQKIYFPRIIIPLSKAGVVLLDFLISFILLILMMLYFSIDFSASILLIPFVIFGLLVISLGTGLLISSLTIRFRDVQHIVPFFIQIWMYLSPIIYPPKLVPPEYQIYLYLNPVAGFIEAFRSLLLGSEFQLQHMLISSVTGVLTFIVGLILFTKTQKHLADLI